MAGKKDSNPAHTEAFEKCLDQMANIYLANSPFLNGFNDITFADLMAVAELEQPIAGG